MKKLASGLLALTLVLGISTSAFAAVYPDNEPNNSYKTANPFYPAHGNQINGTLGSKINGVTDSQDYFTFTATANQKLRFQLAYSKAGGQDFRLEFLNGDATTPTKDYIDVDVVAGKTYYFSVAVFTYNYDYNNGNYSVYSYVLPN